MLGRRIPKIRKGIAIHGFDNKEVPQREKTAGSLRDACLCMLGEWPVGV